MKSYFKTVKLMLSADKSLLLKCFVIVIIFLGMEAVIPIYMEWLINRVEQNKNVGIFLIYLLIFAVAYLLLCFVDATRAETYEYLGKHILWKTREKIYNVLWHSDYVKYVKSEKEKLKFIISTETYVVFAVTTVYTINLVINFLTIVVFLAVSYFINSFVALILLLAFVMTLLLSFYTGKKILVNYEGFDNAKEADTVVNHENVDMVEVTRTNGLIPYYLEKTKSSLDMFIETSAKSDKAEAFWSNMERGVHYFIYVLISGVLMLSSKYNGGQLVTALFICSYLLEVSRQFQRQLQVLLKNVPVFDKVMEAAEIPVETGVEIQNVNSIVFDAVELSFSEERNVFDNLSFELHKGDNVLIKGENGSGKSSVLKMIAGLVKPTKGTIQINDINIMEYDKQGLYKEICYVSQDETLLNESVQEYLRCVTHVKVSDDFIAALRKKVKLNSEISDIVDNGRDLSGGEKKKLLIMKAMLRKDASVVLLDEIDAGLDIETKNVMKQFEKELLENGNVIVIKISHIDTDNRGYNKIITL